MGSKTPFFFLKLLQLCPAPCFALPLCSREAKAEAPALASLSHDLLLREGRRFRTEEFLASDTRTGMEVEAPLADLPAPVDGRTGTAQDRPPPWLVFRAT